MIGFPEEVGIFINKTKIFGCVFIDVNYLFNDEIIHEKVAYGLLHRQELKAHHQDQ